MNEISSLLKNDGGVTINRALAHALGINEALIFAALVMKHNYYSEHDMLDKNGRFYCTIADLWETTALSKSQQSTAVKRLTEAGLIESASRGIPAKRYFKINEDPAVLSAILEKGRENILKQNPLANINGKTKKEKSEKFSAASQNRASCGQKIPRQEVKNSPAEPFDIYHPRNVSEVTTEFLMQRYRLNDKKDEQNEISDQCSDLGFS